ncbi:MAG: YdeI/OmpD-associated family protein [Bacteroidales bacterium]|nr:YdeI/OmpD-associated family protein [Bacteroidales bacterium]
MKELEPVFFKSRESFREWLGKNHATSGGIWMIYYKKQVNAEAITYKEALEEALCFGWIDSIIKKVDDEKYVRKFTPRTNISNWSEVNKRIVLSLIEKGRMTEAGLAKMDWKSTKPANDKNLGTPDFILNALAGNEPALTNFNNLAQTYKRHYILWITTAKKEETRLARLKEAIELLKENRRLSLK